MHLQCTSQSALSIALIMNDLEDFPELFLFIVSHLKAISTSKKCSFLLKEVDSDLTTALQMLYHRAAVASSSDTAFPMYKTDRFRHYESKRINGTMINLKAKVTMTPIKQ